MNQRDRVFDTLAHFCASIVFTYLIVAAVIVAINVIAILLMLLSWRDFDTDVLWVMNYFMLSIFSMFAGAIVITRALIYYFYTYPKQHKH